MISTILLVWLRLYHGLVLSQLQLFGFGAREGDNRRPLGRGTRVFRRCSGFIIGYQVGLVLSDVASVLAKFEIEGATTAYEENSGSRSSIPADGRTLGSRHNIEYTN